MIIAVTSTGDLELRDADNFRAFKIVDELGGDLVRLAAALEGIGKLTPDGAAAWVAFDRVPWLPGRRGTEEWESAFHAMIAGARRFGWINDQDRTVRAHVERSGTESGPAS
jgi:hypothetical protein